MGAFKILRGNKVPLQKTSSTSEGNRKAESGLMGLLVGCQSSTRFTNPVAVATTPAIDVVPKVIAATSNHLSRDIGVITDRIARFPRLDKIMLKVGGKGSMTSHYWTHSNRQSGWGPKPLLKLHGTSR